MTPCKVSEERLQRWFDSGAEPHHDMALHIHGCAACRQQVDAWQQAGHALRQIVDQGVGEIEPLVAVQAIHARIAAARERSWSARWGMWWQDLWTFNRRAAITFAAAAFLGAVSAPVAIGLMESGGGDSSLGPNAISLVVVESLEFDGNARPVVYRPSGATAIIWVEPEALDGVVHN